MSAADVRASMERRVTIRYRTMRERKQRCALPCPPNWMLWWQWARLQYVPWNPFGKLPSPDEQKELRFSRRGL